MKNQKLIFIFLFMLINIILLNACKKEDIENLQIENIHRIEIKKDTKNIRIEEIPYNKFGEIHGYKKTWYPNGMLKSIIIYENGLKHGIYKIWHSNGNLAEEGLYIQNEKEGLSTGYHLNGSKKFEINYSNGFYHGFYTTWKKDGNIDKIRTYKDGLLESSNSEWDPIRQEYFTMDKIEIPSFPMFIREKRKTGEQQECNELTDFKTWDEEGNPLQDCKTNNTFFNILTQKYGIYKEQFKGPRFPISYFNNKFKNTNLANTTLLKENLTNSKKNQKENLTQNNNKNFQNAFQKSFQKNDKDYKQENYSFNKNIQYKNIKNSNTQQSSWYSSFKRFISYNHYK